MSKLDKLKAIQELIKVYIQILSIGIFTTTSGIITLFLIRNHLELILLGIVLDIIFVGVNIFLTFKYLEISEEIEKL